MPDRQHGTSLIDGPPRWLLAGGIAVAGTAVVAVLAMAVALRAPTHRPLTVGWVPAPQATSRACRAVTAALPQRVADYQRATPAQPAPPATAAWSAHGEAIVLRCGINRPAGFVVGAPIQVVDAVQWFQETDGGSSTTWVCVDRPVYIALRLPQGSGPTPIQDVSDVIAATIPAVPINPGPPPG